MNAVELKSWLAEVPANSVITDLVENLFQELPAGPTFEEDFWNVIDWETRSAKKRTSTLNFSNITHNELRKLGKLWVLDGRLKRKLGVDTAQSKILCVKALSQVLGARRLQTLKTDDFYEAQKLLRDSYGAGTSYRLAVFLESASSWLGVNLGKNIDYHNTLIYRAVHGRYGTDEGKADKFIPSEALRDMLEARHRDNLIPKDKFYLSVFAVQVAAGFRISDLASLPADCLRHEGDLLQILHYPSKGGRPVPRPIHPSMKELVLDAVTSLLEKTGEARALARKLRTESRLDWSAILADADALRYFAAKWAHEWSSNPNHLMINPAGAWHSTRQCFMDAIGALERSGGVQTIAAQSLGVNRGTFSTLLATQEAARRGELPPIMNGKRKGQPRDSWDTDARVVSFLNFEKHTSVSIKRKTREVFRDILEEAQRLQLAGKEFPAPIRNRELEDRFSLQLRPLIKNKDGKALLYPDEALLVTQKYALSEHRGIKTDEFTVIGDRDFSHWLTGEARSLGTGNHEDSVFRRLGIIDPRTGECIKFTSHDVRHWLNTIYQNGGLTEDQIALIFNRKHKQQNAVYDQTSNKERASRMKQAIRDRIAIGRATETYSVIAEFSRDDAEDYLEAVVRMVNPMPHGVCMLDWSAAPCPHHLSCFSCESEGPCEHLIVDPGNNDHVHEMERISREADLSVDAIKAQGMGGSRQIDHFKRVHKNVNIMLNQILMVKVEKEKGVEETL